MPPHELSPTLWSVALSPLDVTPDEWNHLRAHWLDRTDHFGLWAMDAGDSHFADVEAYADRRPTTVTCRYDGYVEMGGDVDADALVLLRDLLTPDYSEGQDRWTFPQLDVRLFSGDLRFLGIHDHHIFDVIATEAELDYYRAFGLTDREFHSVTRWHEQTWSYRVTYGDNNSSPEARLVGDQPLSADDLVPRLADIAARHPTISLPPFSLAPSDGIAGREFRRRLASAMDVCRGEIERYWPNVSLLHATRQRGAVETLQRLSQLSYPDTRDRDAVAGAVDALVREASEAIAGAISRRASGLVVGGELAVVRTEAHVDLAGGRRLILLAHFAATDGPAPDMFAVAYRLEDKHGVLIWQYDECPALSTPHKHIADGMIEPVERMPTPGEAAREAVATQAS